MSNAVNTAFIENAYDSWSKAFDLWDLTAMRAVEWQLRDGGFSKEAQELVKERLDYEKKKHHGTH